MPSQSMAMPRLRGMGSVGRPTMPSMRAPKLSVAPHLMRAKGGRVAGGKDLAGGRINEPTRGPGPEEGVRYPRSRKDWFADEEIVRDQMNRARGGKVPGRQAGGSTMPQLRMQPPMQQQDNTLQTLGQGMMALSKSGLFKNKQQQPGTPGSPNQAPFKRGGVPKRQSGGDVRDKDEGMLTRITRAIPSWARTPIDRAYLDRRTGETTWEGPEETARTRSIPNEDFSKDGRARGGRLTAAQRQAMPRSQFALPGKGKGPKGAGAGSYPIPDRSHAANALSRVSQHGSSAEKAAVRAKVRAKFPDMGKGK